MAAPSHNISAAVLGSGTQPLDYLLAGQQRAQQRSDQLRLLAQKRRDQRDRDISRLYDVAPEKTWDPARQEVEQAFQTGVRDWTTQQLNNNVDYADQNFLNEWQNRISKANTLAALNSNIGKKYTNTMDLAKKGKFYTKDIIGAINDVVYNEDGSYRGSDNVDTEAFEKILSGGDYLDEGAVTDDFVETLPDIIEKTYGVMTDKYGNQYFENRDITRSVFASDNDFDPKTGKPKVIINDDLVSLAMQHDDLRKILNKSGNPKKKLEELLQGRAKYETKKTPGRAISDGSDGSGGDANITTKDWTRYQTVRNAIYKFDEKALASAVNIIDGVDVKFMGDKYLPGETKPDRIEVTLPPNSDGERRREVLWLRTPKEQENALFFINQLIDENNASKYKVGTDKFTKMHEDYTKEDPADLNDFLGLD